MAKVVANSRRLLAAQVLEDPGLLLPRHVVFQDAANSVWGVGVRETVWVPGIIDSSTECLKPLIITGRCGSHPDLQIVSSNTHTAA